MTYIDIEFAVFLALSLGLFYIFPVKARWIALLISSLAFYVICGWEYLPFILVTTITVYLAGLKIGNIYKTADSEIEAGELGNKEKKQIKDNAKKKARKYLILLLILNIGILCVIKFTRFFEGPINTLLAKIGAGEFDASCIIVPLGISYYTFSCVSYIMDVYWRRCAYEKNYARFLLFAAYFPHILQGPIERYGKLGERLKGEFRFDYDRFCKGLQLILWGLFKKLVIADRINIFTTAVYAKKSSAEGLIYLIAFFLDVVYIYADFSGCMDIAAGASQLFGVEMDKNFDHPFSSKTVVEFWHRWHMSLGSWFREYVYYPISTSGLIKKISKSSKKHFSDSVTRAFVTVIPVFCTWILTGLWHGTGKTYIAWGLYYSILIFLSVSLADVFTAINTRLGIDTEKPAWKAIQVIRTTCIFAGGRLLTRPGSLRLSFNAFVSVFKDFNPWILSDGTIYKFGIDQKNFTVMLISIAIFGLVGHYQQKFCIRDKIAEQNIIIRWAFYLAALAAILLFGIYGPGYDAASFVYMAY